MLGTNNIDHHRTADYTAFARAISGHPDRAASLRETMTAPAILLLGNDPTEQHPLLAWNLRTNLRHHNARIYVVNHAGIKLERQAHQSLIIPQDGYANAVRFLAGEDAAFPGTQLGDEAKKFREALRAEPNLLIIFGSEYPRPRHRRAGELWHVAGPGPLRLPGRLRQLPRRRGYGPAPGLPPRLRPVAQGGAFAEEYGDALPQTPGMDLVEMFDAAERGDLAALYVVGANPIARYGIDPAALKSTFVIVQDMFLTETAQLADVVLPTSNLYEKAGTVTNTYGDQQLVKKAGDRAGVRSDFELMVRLADCMGADPRKLVPFGRGVHADMGQTRGAQSGEADRHAVWLAAQNLEPKLSPFDPFAILDEIQRLVPGYQVSRMELLAGNDVHVQSSLVQIDAGPERHALILPGGRYTLYLRHFGAIQHHPAFGHGVAYHQTRINNRWVKFGKTLNLERNLQGRALFPHLAKNARYAAPKIVDSLLLIRTRQERKRKTLVSFLIFFLLSCLKIAVVLAIFLGAVAYTVLLERKLVGRIQNRWGPSRVGPFGLMQPMADGLKLFLKEDLLPTNVYRPLYILAPMIALGCALISISVVPFGARITWHGVDMFEIANVNIGLLVILGVTSVGVYGIALAGWSSNNKYSLLGALRSSAQVISYELALGLSRGWRGTAGRIVQPAHHRRQPVGAWPAVMERLWGLSIRRLLHLPHRGLCRDQPRPFRSARG